MESPPAKQFDTGRCPLCGNPNNCQLCATDPYKGPCWCAKVEIPDALLAQVPLDLRNKACICRHCIMEFHRSKNSGTTRPQISSDDFYFENGLMVFKAAWHLRRGYCCGSNCRHCPY
ncbi:MAG TPA: cysteine-rich CWC family protein [Alphaproteobacteria bacterium]|nr:cysteine-rich CWC family protein [Alphaproteobacteria bacterium]